MFQHSLSLVSTQRSGKHVYIKTCTWMLLAALFIIAQSWKQTRCSLACEWIHKLWSIQTTGELSALTRDARPSHRKACRKGPWMHVGEWRKQVWKACCSVWLFVTPWTAARQASLSFTISQSLLKLLSIEWVMPSNHPDLYYPLLLLPSIFPSSRIFSNELALCIRWQKYWSFSTSSSNEYSELISLALTGWNSLLFKGLSRVFSGITVQRHQFFSTQPSLWSNFHIHTWLLEKT